MSVTLEGIQEARAVEAEFLTGKLALCMRMWTSRQSSRVKDSAAQQMPVLVNLGKLGDQARGRE